MGVLALIEGIPVFYDAPRWICEDGATPFRMFPGINVRGREEALQRMAHGQWHYEEIATGEPFARIIANRSKAIW
jgi:hypothetical protein